MTTHFSYSNGWFNEIENIKHRTFCRERKIRAQIAKHVHLDVRQHTALFIKASFLLALASSTPWKQHGVCLTLIRCRSAVLRPPFGTLRSSGRVEWQMSCVTAAA